MSPAPETLADPQQVIAALQRELSDAQERLAERTAMPGTATALSASHRAGCHRSTSPLFRVLPESPLSAQEISSNVCLAAKT